MSSTNTTTKAGHLAAGDVILCRGTWQMISRVKHSTRTATVTLYVSEDGMVPASIYREFETRKAL